MNKSCFFSLAFGVLVAACGGKAEMDGEQLAPVPTVEPAGDAGPEAAVEQDAGKDSAVPETAAETGTDAGCFDQVKVKVVGPKDYATSPDSKKNVLLNIQLTATDCLDVPVDSLDVAVRGTLGESVCTGDCSQSNGWNFQNVWVTYAGVGLAGPAKLSKGSDGAGHIQFSYPMPVKAGTTVNLDVVADIPADEVSPGTLFGHSFHASLESVGVSSAKHPDTIDLELPAQGGTITVGQPAPQASYCGAVTSDPSEEYGFWGCCGTFKQATNLTVGQLFKGSGKPVYYLAHTWRRFVFPTSVVLDSWYSQKFVDGVPQRDDSICNQVVEIADDALAAYAIGGNVRLRPGVYVTGIETDPKRYVVAKGGVLHWLESDAVGEMIYPGTYQARVRRVRDAFFADYTIGMSYPTGGQYDLAAALAVTIEQDLGTAP